MGGSGGRRVRHRTGGYCGWACCCGDGGGRGAVPWFMFMFLEVKELGFGFDRCAHYFGRPADFAICCAAAD